MTWETIDNYTNVMSIRICYVLFVAARNTPCDSHCFIRNLPDAVQRRTKTVNTTDPRREEETPGGEQRFPLQQCRSGVFAAFVAGILMEAVGRRE